jgi:CHAD domain-containing protein
MNPGNRYRHTVARGHSASVELSNAPSPDFIPGDGAAHTLPRMPSVHLERERKLAVPVGFELPPDLGKALPAVTLVSTYHDTPDHRLALAGITLRRREQRGRASWQLKLPAGDARSEVEMPDAGAVPQEALDLLAAHLRGDTPQPVATLRTQRRRRRVSRGGREVAEVAHDVVVIDGAAGPGSLEEVEVELLDGGTDGDLERLTGALRKAGATPGDQRSKLARALDLPAAPAADLRTARARLGSVLSAQVAAMLAHDPHVRLGGDPEALHQFRVATRRLRALLRAARPSLDREWADGLRRDLGTLASATGDARDLDVFSAHLAAAGAALDADAPHAAELLALLTPAREAARARVVTALRDPGYATLVGRLVTECAAPPVTRRVRPGAVVAAEFRRLCKAAAAVKAPGDAELHRMRIAGKRARYAAELAAEPGDQAAGFLRSARRLQDVLGEHQDAVVAEAHLRDIAAAATGPVALTAGRLVERERRRRESCRARLPAAWRAMRRSARRWKPLNQ